jgi:polyisoprenoid-binding protein YceI
MQKFIAVLVICVAGAAQATKWTIDDAHSTARFKVKHLMVSNVSGEITGAKGHLDLDDKTNALKEVDVTLDATTINTQNAKRDGHLKNEDFFDTANHPNITFKSKKITKAGKGTYTIVGDLTMRGVTKEVTLKDGVVTDSIKDPWGNTRRGFSAATKLNRQDWGLKWNKVLEGGGLTVGDEVDVNVEAEITSPKTEKKG